MELLENIDIDHDLNLDDFRFPVQWVCRPGTDEHHDFRGYMGVSNREPLRWETRSSCCR